MTDLTRPRAELLAELEHLVGQECYNDNIQNWGPGGVFLGEGRGFRYPLTRIDRDRNRVKTRNKADADDPEVLASGYYAFGANRLHIVRALDRVLSHLEENHGLTLERQ